MWIVTSCFPPLPLDSGLLTIWLLFEGAHYLYHRWLTRETTPPPHPITPPSRDGPTSRRAALLDWDRTQRAHVPDLSYHEHLETRALPYCTGVRAVYRPHYRPLLYYGLTRLLYYTGTLVAQTLGWRRERYQGRIIWRRGPAGRRPRTKEDVPPIVFCHGFGFGVFPYLHFLHRLSHTQEVIAPEYPGICHDGRTTCPVTEHAAVIEHYLGPRPCHLLSNSFGSFVHQALLHRRHLTVCSQVYAEPVCFYPYFGRLFDFIEVRGRDILYRGLLLVRQAVNRRDRGTHGDEATSTPVTTLAPRQWLLQLLSYIAVTGDPNVLRLCQELLLEPWWDAERHLTTIPTQIVFSAQDHIIESMRLQQYFRRYPGVACTVLPGRQHGDALTAGAVGATLVRCAIVDTAETRPAQTSTRLQLKFPPR